MLKKHEKSFLNIQKFFDSLFTAVFWLTSYLIRFQFIPNAQEGLELQFILITPLLILLTLYSFDKNDLYSSQRFTSKYREILSVVRANTYAMLGLVILIYFSGEEKISRLTILIYLLISSSGFIIIRLSIRNLLRSLRRKGKNLRHVLLVGNGEQLNNYISMSYRYKDSGIRFLGWIDSGGKAKNTKVNELDDNYLDLESNTKPDSIILSYQGSQASKATDFIRNHYNDIIPIQLLPDLSYSMIGHRIEDFAGIPLLTVNSPSFNIIELFLKRFIELSGTIIGLLILSPILLVISIAVKLSSPGPIFFSQRRVGLDGCIFKMWKFRSMRINQGNESTTEWSNKDNPRKTKVGNFLRKTSLDELPQLFNVLYGDMSLVGPRPEQPHFVEKFRHDIPGYMLKHKMKPGITGWAQINGWRGDTDLNKRIECDIYYIKNWSIWLDLKIIFLTFWKGFIHKNAY